MLCLTRNTVNQMSSQLWSQCLLSLFLLQTKLAIWPSQSDIFYSLFFILYPIKDPTFCPIVFSSPNGDCLPHEILNEFVSQKLSFKCFLTLGTQQKLIGLKLISIQIGATIITLFCLLRMPASIFSFQTNHPHFFKAKFKPQLF